MTVFVCDKCSRESADLTMPPGNWDSLYDYDSTTWIYRCPVCGWSDPLVDPHRY